MNLINTCPGPTSRRSFLKMGALGVSGLSLAEVMRLRAEAGQSAAAPDTSVIFVWLAGGPPHMETYDMKPDAPEDYRGQFSPISTNVPGIDVCELLPMHAKIADKFTLIRSIAHKFNDHGGGSKRFMTGRVPDTPTGTKNDSPSVISIVNKMRENLDVGLPNCVTLANGGRSKVNTYAQGAAYLGMKYNYFPVGDDPSSPKFAVRNMYLGKTAEERLGDRRQLLSGLDRLRSDVDASGAMEAADEFSQKAFGLLTSPQMHDAFDLSSEPQSLRERYGMHGWGQRALMARRLVEAGCSFVTVAMENPFISGVKYPKGQMFSIGSSTAEQAKVVQKYFNGKRPSHLDFEADHTITLSDDFFIGQYEVTRGQFRRFVEDTNYTTDTEATDGGYGWNEELKKFEGRDRKYSWKNYGVSSETDEHPVTNITRNDARKFCDWLAKKGDGKIRLREVRLPGEAEWEFVCRAGSRGRFSFGDDHNRLTEFANVQDGTWAERFSKSSAIQTKDGHAFSAPVGQFKPNAFGLYDMHGNVWEWVEDFYGKYSALPKERNAIQTVNQGQKRPVMRGGAWYVGPSGCRCANRWLVGIGGRYGSGGFRVVCVP